MTNTYAPGDPVVYQRRHFVVVRYLPGYPRQVIIQDDEGEQMRVEERRLLPA